MNNEELNTTSVVEEKQTSKTHMTPRQWRLYNYLNKCFEEDSTRWVSPREIHDNVCGYIWDSKAYDHCKGIRNDKKIINALDEMDKIIVMKNRYFKISTKEEAIAEMEQHYKRAMTQLWEYSNINHKYKLDGQFKLLNNRGEEMTPNAKPFREVFSEEMPIVNE